MRDMGARDDQNHRELRASIFPSESNSYPAPRMGRYHPAAHQLRMRDDIVPVDGSLRREGWIRLTSGHEVKLGDVLGAPDAANVPVYTQDESSTLQLVGVLLAGLASAFLGALIFAVGTQVVPLKIKK